MSIKRLIPVIQIDKDYQAVKTSKFKKRRYVGDALNLLRIYNDLGVDEVALWNIDRLPLQGSDLLPFLSEIAAESRMPLSYGGNLCSLGDVSSVISLGFEKVAFSYSTIRESTVPLEAISMLGVSGVQVVLNFKKDLLGRYVATCHRTGTRLDSVSQAVNAITHLGVGEIILQSIDRDGTGVGLDMGVLKEVGAEINCPIVLSGGLRTHTECLHSLQDERLSGVASGTCFTFSSRRLGVLPSYPSDSSRGL